MTNNFSHFTILIDNSSEDFIDRIMNENMWTRDYKTLIKLLFKKIITCLIG